MPDVEVAAELIRAEIAEDAEIMGEFVDFDPYAGNLLEPIVRYDGPSEKSAFLAFPMGELNRDLSKSNDSHCSVKPSKDFASSQTFLPLPARRKMLLSSSRLHNPFTPSTRRFTISRRRNLHLAVKVLAQFFFSATVCSSLSSISRCPYIWGNVLTETLWVDNRPTID